MARDTFGHTDGMNGLNTAITTLITALGTAGTTASESNATVTADIAKVQAAVTAAALTQPVVVDVDLSVVKTRKALESKLFAALDFFTAAYNLK